MNQFLYTFILFYFGIIPSFTQSDNLSDTLLFSLNSQWNNFEPYPQQPLNNNPFSTYRIDQTFIYFFNGDSTIQNHKYSKVFRTKKPTVSIQDQENEYMGAIRQMENQVYYIPKYTANELLLYDFDINVGDTLSVEQLNIDYIETVNPSSNSSP